MNFLRGPLFEIDKSLLDSLAGLLQDFRGWSYRILGALLQLLELIERVLQRNIAGSQNR